MNTADNRDALIEAARQETARIYGAIASPEHRQPHPPELTITQQQQDELALRRRRRAALVRKQRARQKLAAAEAQQA